MPDIAVFPELELIDSLIAGLEALIVESDEIPLKIESHQQPRRAIYKSQGAGGPADRRTQFADAVYLDEKTLILRCQDTQVVRQTPLQVTIQAEKTGRGEVMAIITGKAKELKRIRGGYDIEVEIAETRKIRHSSAQKLRDYASHGDAAGWNRWCHDITGIIELMGTDLQALNLNGFDLCCADLTGSNFTGANLSGAILAGSDIRNCIVDRVTAVGADFFNTRMNRAQAVLLQQAGMPEVESILFEAD